MAYKESEKAAVRLPQKRGPFGVEDGARIGGLSREDLIYLSPSVPELLKLSPTDRMTTIIQMCLFLLSPGHAEKSRESYIPRAIVVQSLLQAGFRVGSPDAKQEIVWTINQLVLGGYPKFRTERSPDVLVVIAEELGNILWRDKVYRREGETSTSKRRPMIEACGGTVVFPLLKEHRHDLKTCLRAMAGLDEEGLETHQAVPYVPKVVAGRILEDLAEGKVPRYPFASAALFYDLPKSLVRKTLSLADSLPPETLPEKLRTTLALD